MFNDKIIAIIGLIGVSMFAIYQGGAEAYELVKIITSAIAGFVTGTAYVSYKKTTKEETPDGTEESRPKEISSD